MPLIPSLPDRKTEKRKDPPKFLRQLPDSVRNRRQSFDNDIDLSILMSVLPSPKDVFERELEWNISDELAKLAIQQQSSAF
ncbi:Oidioi.mRNA.OKI2018_I69.PAR.g9674.t1.cds [Oikopleura dioica]|uniref:Oidioi.mRNA.OKI2018_I69.PAR.g9674.t1.cds n=1 Tax=Oikopleura dioica TaxID=34765 RepID=A0ABN7RQT5_OIKDI|nr:Oidioi.mRNA.OKI2018_I69.PAR.g9674.t1.cds [Oikopleura dioica]